MFASCFVTSPMYVGIGNLLSFANLFSEIECSLTMYYEEPGPYCAKYPPSITRDAPVMYEASSEAKNNTPKATSSGVPRLPIGVRSSTVLLLSDLLRLDSFNIGVSIGPG